MTEHQIEPLWVGIDVDAELARYAKEDRRRATAEQATPPRARRFPRRRGLSAAPLRLATAGSIPRPPLTA